MQNEIVESFETWLAAATEDKEVAAELLTLAEAGDEAAIHDRFYRQLEFGTGGLRGELGAGTGRMNIYTVRKATQGLADWLNASGHAPSVAIGYDSRIKSDLFAREAARVLAANGITAHLFPRLQPTPAVSFAVRSLGCGAGVMVTASHNPAEYNGYKVYGPDGCQITTEAAAEILAEIEAVDPFDGVEIEDFDPALENGDIRIIAEDTLDAFLDAVAAQSVVPPTGEPLRIVYTPLNGAGRECVLRILERVGITDVTVVPEQAEPNGHFPTCPYPNPEIREALQKGLDLCETVGPDLLLATDPDCDRVGIAVNQNGSFQLLSGNEVGVLLFDYICQNRKAQNTLPERPVAVKTIVTTDMATAVAKAYGVELRETLTGFKFIGEQIGLLEENGEESRYIFGFEESYGYLSGGYVRDKDGVNGAMLICEMAAWYKQQGLTLVDAMQALYAKYGAYKNELLSFTFKGAEGMAKMQAIMASLRGTPPASIAGLPVETVTDYAPGLAALPPANVLEFRLAGEARLIIRPSGTEPKIKVYLSAKGETMAAATATCETLSSGVTELLGA